MKIVFISNYFNHHQWPLSDALYRITEGNYRFIETSSMRQDRRELGYGWEDIPEYVISAHHGERAKQQGMEWISDADVVIAGSAPEAYLKERIQAGKLVFRYSERPLKRGMEPLKYIPRLICWRRNNPQGKPVYLLCASGYAADDYAKFGLFRNKAYRWGYFPEFVPYAHLPEKEETDLLWVGRFLDWKHPDDALRAAAMLREKGMRFHLRFIGTGPMEQRLRELTNKLKLTDHVSFLGAMRPEQVRRHMERSSIVLFTSDRQEGWGAVVNEAMNSGCAVVASHAAGCVPYLIKDGHNGLVYRSGDVRMLCDKLIDLLEHPQQRVRMAAAAYETIAREWNAENAAAKLVKLAEDLLSGMEPCDQEGLCGRANGRMKKRP